MVLDQVAYIGFIRVFSPVKDGGESSERKTKTVKFRANKPKQVAAAANAKG